MYLHSPRPILANLISYRNGIEDHLMHPEKVTHHSTMALFAVTLSAHCREFTCELGSGRGIFVHY